jgi:hypothetical protein
VYDPAQVGTTEQKAQNLYLYPNPAKTWLTLPEDVAWIRIFNLNGTLVLEKASYQEERLELAGLPSGFYCVKTNLGAGKLLIQH